MVSRKQPLASHAVIGAAFAVAFLAAPAFSESGSAVSGKKFYPDDPVLQEPPPRPVKDLAKRDVDDIYDFLDNSFVTPRREGKLARQGPHRALDVNTLGDVPDSAWYTNRATTTRCRSKN